jgi:hypothetical protein
MDDRNDPTARPTRDADIVLAYVHDRYRRRQLAQRGAASLASLIVAVIAVAAVASPAHSRKVQVLGLPKQSTTTTVRTHGPTTSSTASTTSTSLGSPSATSATTSSVPQVSPPGAATSTSIGGGSGAPSTTSATTTTITPSTTTAPKVVGPTLSNFSVTGAGLSTWTINFSYGGSQATCILHNGQAELISWPCRVGSNSHPFTPSGGSYDLWVSAANAGGSAQTTHVSRSA